MEETPPPDDQVTRLLRALPDRPDAWEELLPLVYDELRALARRKLDKERAGHTLQATALVHEAFLRLTGNAGLDVTSRRHFFGAAAEAMRRVMIDHARKVRSEKRGGGAARLEITVSDLVAGDDPEALLLLDEALGKLQAADPRAAEVARLRLFAGLDADEVASVLETSARTVRREWAYARARLAEWVGAGGAAEPG